MTINTKGLVDTKIDAPFFVASRIARALKNFLREENQGKDMIRIESFRAIDVKVEMIPESDAVRFLFKSQEEMRMMYVFFGSPDDRDICEKPIVMSIGCHGRSEEIIQAALESVSMLGDIYFRRNDSVGKYEKVDIAPLTFVDACNRGLETGSGVSLKKWLSVLTKNPQNVDSLETAIGLPRDKIDRIVGANYDEGRMLLRSELEKGRYSKRNNSL